MWEERDRAAAFRLLAGWGMQIKGMIAGRPAAPLPLRC
jgi:hypothetical protein